MIFVVNNNNVKILSNKPTDNLTFGIKKRYGEFSEVYVPNNEDAARNLINQNYSLSFENGSFAATLNEDTQVIDCTKLNV